ncbi:MAG: cobyrinate a,c-diamide synthase [Candidatus Limiplasma sp.]|nr:cobyrinate a,c-diamide synthase [Candidatus Limiplasma sp.]
MNDPRVLLAAPASGSGKTMITCGILQALHNRGMRVSSFKCGPDYIDPMFHEKVIGIRSGNLDLFFSDEASLRRLFCRNAEGAQLSVIEGVMGYYDGQAAMSDDASTYKIARALQTPVVLIVNARGQSLSALAVLEGFLRFRPDSGMRGVIFNQMSERVFLSLKGEIDKMGVVPLGYVPRAEELVIESRHLGLVTPDEIANLSGRLCKLAALLEKTLDIDALIALAADAPVLTRPEPEPLPVMPKTRLAVARDAAFCFFYKDNLLLLEKLGAELLYFSPIHDEELPQGAQGLLLPGGYPELYAKALSENTAMRASVAKAVRAGMPCLAECGGFLYLHRELEDMNGVFYPMCGVLDERAWRTPHLKRFGYVTLTAQGDSAFLEAGESIRGHEFHYYESGDCGNAMMAEKPSGDISWRCIHAEGNLLAGFPHLFYESNPRLIARFLRRCAGEE